MDQLSLLVTRQGVADDIRRKTSYDEPSKTTRITRRRGVLNLLRRTVMTKTSTPAPRGRVRVLG
jgi:hypothetical protein